MQASFLYDYPLFPTYTDYIVELYVGSNMVSRSTLSWVCGGNPSFNINNDHSPTDNDYTYTTSISYRNGSRPFTVTYLADQDIYLIENGADFIAWEIGNVQDEMHGYLTNQISGDWPIKMAEYFFPNTLVGQGIVEDLREDIIDAVCSGHTGCTETKIRYLIGTSVTDTSALGNIAFGYVLDDPTSPDFFSSLEDAYSNLGQFFNIQTLEEAGSLCYLTGSCWMTFLLSQDNSDDIVQRAAGHEFASQVRNSSASLDGTTLANIAYNMYLQ